MSDNTPYSLRAGLLSQAEHILMTKYQTEYEKVRYLLDRDLIDPKAVAWPKAPTTEEILAEAEKLYKFICTK